MSFFPRKSLFDEYLISQYYIIKRWRRNCPRSKLFCCSNDTNFETSLIYIYFIFTVRHSTESYASKCESVRHEFPGNIRYQVHKRFIGEPVKYYCNLNVYSVVDLNAINLTIKVITKRNSRHLGTLSRKRVRNMVDNTAMTV